MATSTTKKWRVVHRTMGEMTIEAERFVRNGSGTYFYDADGNDVASFGDQEVTAVMPDGTTGSNEGTA